MATGTEYRLIDAPRSAFGKEHDCARCPAESLKRPVWLNGPAGAQPFGTRCAAILLGLVPEAATEPAARKALKPAQDELARQLRSERNAADERERQELAAYVLDTYGFTITQAADLHGKVPGRSPFSIVQEFHTARVAA